nr:hypothetical protein [Burkholderia ambifaria]
MHHEYHTRETAAWALQQDVDAREDCANRNYFAGYCLDAIHLMPAGSMQRIDPENRTPFAAARYAFRY